MAVPARMALPTATGAGQAVLCRQHGHDGRAEAAHRPHREVYLADQQHQHDPHGNGAHGGDLHHQVGEVQRG